MRGYWQGYGQHKSSTGDEYEGQFFRPNLNPDPVQSLDRKVSKTLTMSLNLNWTLTMNLSRAVRQGEGVMRESSGDTYSGGCTLTRTLTPLQTQP